MFQLAKCERLYSKLNLDRPKTSLLPGSWQHILHSQSTVNVLDQPRNPDPRDIRSAPGTFLKTLAALSASQGHVTSNISGHVTTEDEHDQVISDDDIDGGDSNSSVFELEETKQFNGHVRHNNHRNSGLKSNNRVTFVLKQTNLTNDITDKQQRHNIRNFWNQDSAESEQDVDSAKSDCSSNAEQLSDGGTRKRQHLDPDTLCELLRKRGLGDPRSRKPEPFVDPLPLQLKHQQYARRNKFYVEKLKGKSRLDCDFANTQATFFCKRQRGGTRTASATFRQNHVSAENQRVSAEHKSIQNEEQQFVDINEDEHEFLDEDQVQRIQAWIFDVNVAHEQKHHVRKDKKMRITST